MRRATTDAIVLDRHRERTVVSAPNPCLPPPATSADRGSRAVGVPSCVRALAAFRRVKLLVCGYVAISTLTLIAIFLLRDDATAVNSAVWTRGTIVALSALFTLTFTVRATSGSRRAYLRLRIVSAVMLAAIAVIIALPGPFPVWMKLEQGLCGVLLAGVCTAANGKSLRALLGRTA